MPRFAKGSPEALEWAAKMKAARNTKRAGAGKPVLKGKEESNESILAGADAKRAARKRKEAEKAAADKAAAEEDARLKAEAEKEARRGAKKPRAKKEAKPAMETVKKGVAERAKEEGVTVDAPTAAEVVALDKMNVKQLRSKVKDLRKTVCPPVGKMKLDRVLAEIMRLVGASESAPPKRFKDLKIKEAREELRKLRREHCPPVTKMAKAKLLIEAIAVGKVAERLKEADADTIEGIAKLQTEITYSKGSSKLDMKEEKRKGRLARMREARAEKKFQAELKAADEAEAKKKAEEEAEAARMKAEEEAKKKAEAAKRRSVFQGKAVKGRSVAPMRGGRGRPDDKKKG